MTAFDILTEWAKFTKYDPDQHKFNLLSDNYRYHTCGDAIQKISAFDPSGTISVMYAKKCFLDVCREVRIPLYQLLEMPDGIDEERRMWEIFMSKDMTTIEESLLNSINTLVEKTADVKMLGDRNLNKEQDALMNSVEAVVEELAKCKEDLYLRGQGPIQPVTNVSTHIHVFNTLAECLLALETANDGIYLCYVSNNGTSDGYFGFYIRSNGNILSLNERVDEAYPGQHRTGRNGRWMNSKATSLFPYNFIFSFSKRDYLGYASKSIIDEEHLAFMNLTPAAYLPLLLAMVMVSAKYRGYDTADLPLKYSAELLSINVAALESSGTTELTIPETSMVAKQTMSLPITVSSASILDNAAAASFDYSNKSRDKNACGYFDSDNFFVKLYGDGFQLDSSKILKSNPHLKALPSAKDSFRDEMDAEFIGTKDRMELIAYMQGREQLAEYIREKMFEEFTKSGGREGIISWFTESIHSRQTSILDLLKAKGNATRGQTSSNLADSDFISCIEMTGSDVYSLPMSQYPLNQCIFTNSKQRAFNVLCPITGSAATQFFKIQPRTWEDLLTLFHFEADSAIPKIVRGWNRDGHRRIGNPNLDVTDPVSDIGTPFERTEIIANQRLWTTSDWHDYYFHHNAEYPDWTTRKPELPPLERSPRLDFSFYVGFSKRGLKQFLSR